jgi:tripartite-type tricarboxylate transporter receptor subunit TctC
VDLGIVLMLHAALALLASLLLHAGAAHAQAFPAKRVNIVVPFPISGPTDIRGTGRVTRTYRLIAQHAPPPITDMLARTAAAAIGADSHHPVALDRQPGAMTSRGALSVARAPADGHTLLLASNATMIINPSFFYGVAYDPVRDFELVAPLATMPFVLVVDPVLPLETPQHLIDWLKRRPGEINFGSSGDGSTGFIASELLRRIKGVQFVHIPYNGGMAALTGLATGQVSMMFAALPLALPYLASGQLKALGTAGAKRTTLLPDLPTLAESGVRGFEVEGWYGIFARARTPMNATAWLSERISAAMNEPATRALYIGLGLEPITASRAQFATRINSEFEQWAPVLRAARLPLKEPES